MKYTVPDYYHDFQCIADKCPATCCAGWQIVIDEKSLNRYKHYKGAFGNRLKNSIDWEEGVFHQYNGRCAFLDENNLCDIYTEAGPHMFCRTCRNYPRHIEEFENEREISLSLSCPVAAELILGKNEKVSFLMADRECAQECDEDFDFILYSALQDCRSVMLEILQNRENSVSFRMSKVLAVAHDVQNRINARRIFEVESLLERYRRPGADEKLREKLASWQISKRNKCEDTKAIWKQKAGNAGQQGLRLMDLLDELEVLDPSWPSQLTVWKNVLEQADADTWAEARKGVTETELEQLMVYFIFTYFCGAVYDGDAFAKVKMSVVCTLLLRQLWIADRILEQKLQSERSCEVSCAHEEAAKADLGRPLYPEDTLTCSRNRVAWRFSRELEHSDPNLDKMEQMMNERSEASFETLLMYILEMEI